MKIRATTDKECKTILSEAYRKAEIIKGEGDAEAIKIYGKAYGKDMKFYKESANLAGLSEIFKRKNYRGSLIGFRLIKASYKRT